MTIDQIVKAFQSENRRMSWVYPEEADDVVAFLRQKLDQLLMGLEEKFEAKKEALEIEAEWLDTRLMKNDWFEVRYMEAMLALNIKNITDIVKKIAENLAKVAALDEALAECREMRGVKSNKE